MTAPALAASTPLFVVFNPQSGRGNWPQTREALQAACKAGGRPLTLLPLQRGQSPEPVIARAVQGALVEGGIAVAAGGDGTINAVANHAVARGCAFGVLPQGTFNYFSRAHGLPAQPEESVAALLQGRPEAVQVGLVNEQVFLVNASLGFYARLLEDRESYKARYGRSRGVALVAALFTLARGFRIWDLEAHWHGRTETLRTPTLFVGNNPLQFEQVGVEEGEAVEQGELAAIALRPLGRAAMLGLLVQAGLGRLDRASEVQSLSFRELEVAAAQMPRGHRVRVATDGELRWMRMPLRFRVSPKPLWLVKPASLERERG
ncbi:diacylglycerol kinase family protein [Xenophilus sp. Marseille-Q4582]|uniref:diacylglycerol/lipid kinase family protein n=1 Tax=Xenophilus sp. Marseille-Q4582 TaxID=2866600 RepID=UPI001CE3DDBD|nr:diacylglycerol kinase family protein [Xenophilus sp. Marseille-Q4582]